MFAKLTREELEDRIRRLCSLAEAGYPDWDTILVVGRVNQYYLTGNTVFLFCPPVLLSSISRTYP
ncbi:MAG TPA: hypothetical protein VHP38_08890 [Ruminiclostridium sp.]|nr:hypothetical protein [Ruminiclostridium sp.]